MDQVIGYITLNNYNKPIDYYLVLAALCLSTLLMLKLFKKNLEFINVNWEIFKHEESVLKFGLIILLALLSKNFSIISLLLVGILIIPFSKYSIFEIDLFQIANFLGLALASWLILNTANDYFTGFILLCILFGIFGQYRNDYLLVFLLLIYLKFNFTSNFSISDSFHHSEFFTSVFPSERDVFPNIGMTEQLLPFKLVEFFKSIFGTDKFWDLGTARHLIQILFITLFVREVNKFSFLLGVIALIFFPAGRIGLALAAFLAVRLINNPNWSWSNILIMGNAPFLCSIMSPTYAIFYVVAVIRFLLNTRKKNIFRLVFILSLILAETALLFPSITDYILTYSSFSGSNMTAGSLPITNAGWFQFVLKVLNVFSISFLLSNFLKQKKVELLKCKNVLQFFMTLVLIYYAYSYSFGRIDPGPSRAYHMTFLLLFCVLPVIKIPMINLLVFVAVSLIYFPHTIFVDKDLKQSREFFPKNEYVVLNKSYTELERELTTFLNIYPFDIILFSDPALSKNRNFKIPPFSTPWVTIGEYAETKNIEFFKNNSRDIVYLGKSLITFDGVDKRARSPRVFKYLADNYDLYVKENFYFAIPNKYLVDNLELGLVKVEESPLFSNFDLKLSGQYFKGRLDLEETLVVDLKKVCVQGTLSRYRIIATKNQFYINGGCELQYIPKNFLDGEFLRVERII